MKNIFAPLYISGPHGGGKSTLVDRLKQKSNIFIDNNFDIDFTIDFPSLSILSHFEKSLLRVYHRLFVTGYTQNLSKANPGKVVITNRTVIDSAAYTDVYRKLNWISQDQYQKLSFIINNFPYKPKTVILNPSLRVIKERLHLRRDQRTRVNRDEAFTTEDSDIFLENLHNYFERFQNQKNILYLKDNSENDIQKITEWVQQTQLSAALG